MNWLLRIFKKKEKRSGASNPAQWLIDWVTGGAETSSGAKVNENTALKYTPFWAGVRIISGTVAMLPFKVYRRIQDGKEEVNTHPIHKLLNDRPNQYIDSLTFKEVLQNHILTYGNGFAEIQRNGAGRPIALWPLLPDRTERKLSKEGVPYYEIRMQAGGTIQIPDYNVLHIKGLGFDGYTGYDVVSYHKEAIGYGISVKEFGSRFFGNNANPGGVLEHPATLSDKAIKHLQETWEANHRGLSKAHRLQILEEGMKWHSIGIEPEKAQALEIQKYNVDDCSRIFCIPPHKLGSMDRATFSNIEEQNIDFLQTTMLYWFRKWELECNYKLFMPSEYGELFSEILIAGLLRGNLKSRYEAYNIGRNGGWLSVNDIRRLENMNPIGEEGDIYLEPLNMKPAGSETPIQNEPFSSSRTALMEMIDFQWERILRKLINTRNIDYKKQQESALNILYSPVYAYASTKGIGQIQTKKILSSFIEERINESQRYTVGDARYLTNQIIERIGGNHNAF